MDALWAVALWSLITALPSAFPLLVRYDWELLARHTGQCTRLVNSPGYGGRRRCLPFRTVKSRTHRKHAIDGPKAIAVFSSEFSVYSTTVNIIQYRVIIQHYYLKTSDADAEFFKRCQI